MDNACIRFHNKTPVASDMLLYIPSTVLHNKNEPPQ